MPPLVDIPTTALVYCHMIAAMRPALALPGLLTLSIDPAKPDSHLTTIYTAYGAASYLLTPYKYLLLAAAIARWMDIDWPAVLNRFLLRPICLIGEDSCSVCLASPREDELHKRRPAVPIPLGLQRKQSQRGSFVGTIACRGEQAIQKVIEAHLNLVPDIRSRAYA
jgi:hypothetical protein